MSARNSPNFSNSASSSWTSNFNVAAGVVANGRLQLVGRAAPADHRSDCNNSGGYVFIRVKLMIIHDGAKYFIEIYI